MKIDEAQALVATLTAQLKEAGHEVELKVTHDDRSSKKTDYSVKVKKMVTRTNIMTGKEYLEDEDTPGYMSPSREAYWSM